QSYKHIMQEALEINKFEDFVFLLANLLLFDEERRTLAWDSEIQNKIIRLLFVSQKFDKEFSKYSDLFNKYDTTGRHKSEDRKNIRRAIDQWHKHKEQTQKDALLDDTTVEAEKQKIEFRVAELQTELDSVIEHIERLKETLDKETSNLKTLNADTDKLELKR